MTLPKFTEEDVVAILQSIAQQAVELQRLPGMAQAIIETGLYEDLLSIDKDLLEIAGDVENTLSEEQRVRDES